jgi:hypothetical protein
MPTLQLTVTCVSTGTQHQTTDGIHFVLPRHHVLLPFCAPPDPVLPGASKMAGITAGFGNSRRRVRVCKAADAGDSVHVDSHVLPRKGGRLLSANMLSSSGWSNQYF